MKISVSTVVLSLLPALLPLAHANSEQIVRFEGPDLSIQGPVRMTEWGRPTYKEGTIELKGKKFKIFVNSRYGNIGALAEDNTADKVEVLYFTSSFGDSVKESNNPHAVSLSYDGCIDTSYNSLAIVYDITGVDVKDENGASINLKNSQEVKKYLLPNLIRTLENSKSSSAYCRLIEQVEAK